LSASWGGIKSRDDHLNLPGKERKMLADLEKKNIPEKKIRNLYARTARTAEDTFVRGSENSHTTSKNEKKKGIPNASGNYTRS